MWVCSSYLKEVYHVIGRKIWLGVLFAVLLASMASLTEALQGSGPLGDYGDAPDDLFATYDVVAPNIIATFPSVLDPDQESDFILHRFPTERVFLGPTATLELDALVIDQDRDDGWLPASMLTCSAAQFVLQVTVPDDAVAGPIYLNTLFDWNHDGRWSGADEFCPQETLFPSLPGSSPRATPVPSGLRAVEWGIQNIRLDLPPYDLAPGLSMNVLLPPVLTGTRPGELWIRFTVSTELVDEQTFLPFGFGGDGWSGQGDFLFGETEDYFACLVDSQSNFFGRCPAILTFLAGDAPPSDDNKGPKGNEGLGNGDDDPPPGHDENQNDGESTSKGNPGSKGKK